MTWQAKDMAVIALLTAATSSSAGPPQNSNPEQIRMTATQHQVSAKPSMELLQFLGEWQPDDQDWLEQLQHLDQANSKPTTSGDTR